MLGSNLSFQGTAARDVAEFRFPCVHFACMRFACADLCGPKCCGILGREQTGTLVCILRVFVLRVQTSAARNVAESGGGSKPERLCAFCVYAFCVCRPLRPEMLRNRGAGGKPERLCASNLCSMEICKILANFKRAHIRVKPYKALIRRVCMCFAY